AKNASRVHVAWSQRGVGPGGAARIVICTLDAQIQTWSGPIGVGNAPAPLFSNLSGRGHQVMPAVTFAAGRLIVVYYDFRQDTTVRELKCLLSTCQSIADSTEVRNLAGDLLTGLLGKVFTNFIADAAPTGYPTPLQRRHTIDVRAAEALPGAAPVFTSTRVSQYLYGSPST